MSDQLPDIPSPTLTKEQFMSVLPKQMGNTVSTEIIDSINTSLQDIGLSAVLNFVYLKNARYL